LRQFCLGISLPVLSLPVLSLQIVGKSNIAEQQPTGMPASQINVHSLRAML
jgi:hypothetical protein